MITAAVISFGILALAWLLAPGERASTVGESTELPSEAGAEAA